MSNLNPWRTRLNRFTPTSSPFEVASHMMDEMGAAFRTPFFTEALSGSVNTTELFWSKDTNTYLFRVLVPGFAKEQIKVDVSKNHITVEANKEWTAPEGFTPVLRTGFPSSLSFQESIHGTLDPSTADASLVNGVLTVTVKAMVKTSTSNRVEVK